MYALATIIVAAASVAGFKPEVLELLRMSTPDKTYEQMMILEKINEIISTNDQGEFAGDLLSFDTGRFQVTFTKGRALAYGGDVLVILEQDTLTIPGTSAVRLILLDRDGQPRDHITFGVSTRHGRLVSEAIKPSGQDSLRIAIDRFSLALASINITILHNNKTVDYNYTPPLDRHHERRSLVFLIEVVDSKFLLNHPRID